MPKHPDAGSLARLQTRIGYQFHQPGALQRALTHRSFAAEHMERLEFLGDAVLGLIMAEHLHARFPAEDEGGLSRMRASLVCKESLGTIACQWKLADDVQVGDGERTQHGGIRSASIAANAVEAVIGAIFVDGGWEAARSVVLNAWQGMLNTVNSEDNRDAKTRLQELTQGKGWGLPSYRVIDLGVGRSPRFEAVCIVNDERLGKGRGERKKLAELAAAEQAWNKLNT